MSTRSRIGVVRPDGSIDSIYCHSDGYPNDPGVGHVLEAHWTDPKKIEKLLALGDISVLGEVIGKKHNFDWRQDVYSKGGFDACRDDPRDKMVRSYRRDRGEDVSTLHSANYAELWEWLQDSDQEWCYVFENGTWRCSPISSVADWQTVEHHAAICRERINAYWRERKVEARKLMSNSTRAVKPGTRALNL